MRILAINNYSLEKALHDAQCGSAPAHHTWGVDYLQAQGHEVDVALYKVPIGNALKQHFMSLFYCLRNLTRFGQYDVVISFFNPLLGFYAFLKCLGLLKKVRLFTMVHHLTRYPELNRGYEKIFFISRPIMERAKQRYPHLADRMVYLEWGPDIHFYESSYLKCKNQIDGKEMVISTGKTLRDLDLLETACKEVNLPVTIITDCVKTPDGNVVQSGNVGKNAITYKELLSYLKKSKLNAITCVKNIGTDTLCGLTSFIDALVMGQPIIMSDNTNISVNIEKLGIGYIYKAGDKSDLKSKLQIFVDHPELVQACGERARHYALEHSYKNYCKQLIKVIEK